MTLSHLRNISLKWKLLIPFLFLASMGAMTLFVVSYRFQNILVHLYEKKHLTSKYHFFLDIIELKKEQMLSLARTLARDQSVAEAFANRDRLKLMELLRPGYQELNEAHGIKQLHFHTPPATSFLRLHQPNLHGDDMQDYRQTINVARETRQAVGGLERGATGFGIRGIVPVVYQGRQVGTVEVGAPINELFLDRFRKTQDSDVTIYVHGQPFDAGPMPLASTLDKHFFPLELFNDVFSTERPLLRTDVWNDKNVAVIAGPLRNFSNRNVAVVEISADRSQTLQLLKEYKALALIIGLVGLALSVSFVWFISVIFTKRIARVVVAADEIASGHRDTRIEFRGTDELGTMAKAINEMLTSLEESRIKVRVYADNLELMVEQRTRTLKESELSYRTLVENVPLVVYFTMADGQTMYLNRFVEEMLGVSPEDLRRGHELWVDYIHPNDRKDFVAKFNTCIKEGREFHSEYRMIHRDDHSVYVVDHAVPVFNDKKELFRMDGIVLDVTARKELQEKIVQAEELETLSDVSARLAHEIRNPLTSIGGLTRRLLKSFDSSDPRHRKGELIVKEVGKLEKILWMMTSYLEPKSIMLRPGDLNSVVEAAVQKINVIFEGMRFSIQMQLANDLQNVKFDSELFKKILISLMENAFFRMEQEGEIQLATGKSGGCATVSLAYRVPFISDDDIDHFFYPFIVDYPFPEGDRSSESMAIPICRVLIHKHGGIINVNKEEDNLIRITISLPFE